MTPGDVKVVQKWFSDFAILSAHDLDTVLQVFPPSPGFYIGEYEGNAVASAIRVPWSDGHPRVYYGSYYYVQETFRGKGFGFRLRNQVAASHVGSNTLCIDAIAGIDKNMKAGFVDSGMKVLRYEAEKAPNNVEIQLPARTKLVSVSSHFLEKNVMVRKEY